MEKLRYETPEFGFQEMKLSESIAKKCWGFDYCFIDHDADPATDPVKYHIVETGGCEGQKDENVQNRYNKLIEAMSKIPGYAQQLTVADVKVNVMSQWITTPKS